MIDLRFRTVNQRHEGIGLRLCAQGHGFKLQPLAAEDVHQPAKHYGVAITFKRQQPLGKYVVDFVCFEQKIVVELDGGQHAATVEYDTVRDAWLRDQGFRVFRFWNNDVTNNRNSVLETIAKACGVMMDAAPSPLAPLPRGERG